MKPVKESENPTKAELKEDELEKVSGGVGNGNGYIHNGSTDGLIQLENGMLTDGKGHYYGVVCK